MAVIKHGRQASSRIIPAIPRALGPQRREKQEVLEVAPSPVLKEEQLTPPALPAMNADGKEVLAEDAELPSFSPSAPNASLELSSSPAKTELPTDGEASTSGKLEATEADLELPPVEHDRGKPALNLVARRVVDESHAASDEAQLTTPTASQPSETEITHTSSLPPPFYPSQLPFHPPQVPMDPTQSLNGGTASVHSAVQGLVFGGHRDSSNASPAPAPPQSSFQPHPNALPFPGPLPTSSPFIPSGGHGYTYSEPQLPYPPYGYAPPMGPPHHQPRHFYAPQGRQAQFGRRHQEQSYPPRHQHAHLPPAHMHNSPGSAPSFRPNNHMNDASKAIHPDMMRDNVQNGHQFRQPSASQLDGYPPFEPRGPAVQEDSHSMARYLTSQFGHPEFADYIIRLSHVGYKFPPTSLPAHGILLARSPKLRSLMSMPAGEPQNGVKLLNVHVSDRFVSVDDAFIRAIMRLYGEALPDRQEVIRSASPLAQREGVSPEAAQMRFALALAASGHFLQVDEIISHGLLLVGHILGWPTLPQALAFALEGGLSMAFANVEASGKDETSISSSGTPTKFESPTSAPAYGFYSDRLINHIMSFFVHNVPPTFVLSPAAPQLVDPPRLPSEAEPKLSRPASSRLSQIHFGEMKIEDPTSSDPLTTAISSVLLSLPFPLLQNLSESNVLGERLSWPRVAAVMTAVVQEREIRRLRALALRPAGADEQGLWRTTRMEESVEITDRHPLGVRLTRRHAGNDTPPSATSETG